MLAMSNCGIPIWLSDRVELISKAESLQVRSLPCGKALNPRVFSARDVSAADVRLAQTYDCFPVAKAEIADYAPCCKRGEMSCH